MSDDTPTQRLPEPESEPPTQRLETNSATATAEGEELQDEKKKSKALLIALIAIGAALVIAIIVLLIVLLTNNAGGTPQADPTPTNSESESPTPSATPTESESPTPSATPSPTATQAPPPPPPPPATDPAFTAFSHTPDVKCSTGGPEFDPPAPKVTVNWQTRSAVEVWFVFGIGDAAAAQAFGPFAPSGSYTFDYPCGAAQTQFTLTLVANNGDHIHRSGTVTNSGDKF